ncbi:M42 family metallopeptidase [Candidatus Bathyarchaeota archaeon]|nr:M42 family metallopeptidase [Candidatus Bathyarchaeota archaeon]
MTNLVGLLESLSNAFGPPGCEDEVRNTLRKELEEYADETRVDKLGNIFFYKHGKQGLPRVMLAAHMDEVGFIVTFIDNKGFLRFQTVGGITSTVIPGQTILLRGTKGDIEGLVGTKPPHLMKEEKRNKAVAIEELFIDVGASNPKEAEQKGIEIGTTGVFNVKFAELGEGYVKGKALDDRAGCTVLAEVFKALKDSPYNIVAVGTVQEEMGLRGARTAAWQVDPDYALALEGTFAADVPGFSPETESSKLREGPVVTILDQSVIAHPTVLKTLIKVGKEYAIPFQFKKVPRGGTDSGAIHLTKAGIPSGTVAVPCRYIHGPASIAHVDDVKNTVRLVTEFVKAISEKSM